MAQIGLRVTSVVLAFGLSHAVAFGQTKDVEKSVTVTAGQAKQIGVFGRVTPECENGKVSVKLAKPAVNGTVVARPAKLKRGTVQKCQNLEPSVAAIFYQPKPGFVGSDTAVVEVSTDDGKTERHEYTITVE